MVKEQTDAGTSEPIAYIQSMLGATLALFANTPIRAGEDLLKLAEPKQQEKVLDQRIVPQGVRDFIGSSPPPPKKTK
jgi:hypothetical protein